MFYFSFLGNSSSLIGSASEREEYRRTLDEEYQRSLEEDRRKSQQREREEQLALEENQQREKEEKDSKDLQLARAERVFPEVEDLSLPHSTVIVRHTSLGPKGRLFNVSSTFQQVYDWIGSLSPHPKYYQILSYDGKVMEPNAPVESGSYNMLPTSEPIPLTPNGTVSFKGFGTARLDDTTKEDAGKKAFLFQIILIVTILPREIQEL